MKKYFYTDGTTNFGPFTLEELREENISRETLVWFQGMKEWKRADSIAELDELFEFVPPAVNAPVEKATEIQKSNPVAEREMKYPPKTWLAEAILTTILCCFPFAIPAIVYASKVEVRWYAGDYKGAKEASAEAKKWTMVSFFVGIGVVVLSFIFGFIGSLIEAFGSYDSSTFMYY